MKDNEPDFSVESPEIEYVKHEDTESKPYYCSKRLFRDIVIILTEVFVLYLLGKQ